MSTDKHLATHARELARLGDEEGASALIRQLVEEVTGEMVESISLTLDQYSLNSVNGRVALANGARYFYKFHSEEGEDATIAEYYNAELLREHGYLVDIPTFASGEPGRQILLYNLREDPRFADVTRAQELGQVGAPTEDELVTAQEKRDDRAAVCLLESLHTITAQQSADEAIHQLFFNRLESPGRVAPAGGRIAGFYEGQSFALGESIVSWDELLDASWQINGISYRRTLRSLLDEAAVRLRPTRFDGEGGVVAHGDDHNANIWYTTDADGLHELVAFDPAFAGKHVPALLAEVKSTFHNTLAHPLWLYEPEQASKRFSVRVEATAGHIVVDHDWAMSALRTRILQSRAERTWQPLLAGLQDRRLLPDDWARVVRLALMLCPLLVRDLRAGGAGGHTPVSSALGFAAVIQAGSEPTSGSDAVSVFFEKALPARSD